ncbi:alpha/beta hydrolase family protein [Streptomyces sp. NPDC098781]|uniref:alpha/beta hydrolase family protein n=1 Tax=Streptomyces sp. NPDC098781 TaxID=3366097 RepID=UPI00380E92A3
MSDISIENVTSDTGPHYEPYGWHHWPEFPWMSYQLRRALGETQPGGGAMSEVFQAASRMVPGDAESWHTEWLRIADRNRERAESAERAGYHVTARDAWLRAGNYYRSAEFWLAHDDPRRLATYTHCEQSFVNAIRHFAVPGEYVEVPYENGAFLPGYFLRAPGAADGPQPVLIAFGGLDSIKEELYLMVGRGALERGISCLLMDGPGQGAVLRRQGIVTRPDYEVPVGACVDYLLDRGDVDPSRIAVTGSSLGGYYAARAGSKEHRLAAAISHGAVWDVQELGTAMWAANNHSEDAGMAGHIKWVFGAPTMAAVIEQAKDYKLDGVLSEMRCPYLIVHGGYDVLGVEQARRTAHYAKSHGVDLTFHLVQEEQTGAEHCQHDNPTLGMELIGDWLVEVFGLKG